MELKASQDVEALQRAQEALELERLSRLAQGDSAGWKFNRDELYDQE